MFNKSQIKEKITNFKVICACAQCNAEYICDPYSAAKSKVGHLCDACKYRIVRIGAVDFNSIDREFSYNEVTGELLLKYDSLSGTAGSAIGYKHNQGYLATRLGSKDYLVHRLIWLLKTGAWPDQVDHIDHNRSNNSWANLREVRSQDNQRNMGIRKNNTTGVQGVRVTPKGRFQAYIMVDRKQINLGTFALLEDAAAARKQAESLYGFHPNHGK